MAVLRTMVGKRNIWGWSVFSLFAIASCGGSEESVSDGGGESPELKGAIESIPEQSEFVEENEDADSASGDWTYDEQKGELVINFSSSGFECEGPQAGEEAVFEIIELTDETLRISIDQDELTWTRDGEGTGIEGTWVVRDENDETEFLMSIVKGGDVVISGLTGECDEDEDSESYVTDDGCLIAPLPMGADIVTDGMWGDWAENSVSVDDETGDNEGDLPGTDIINMRIASGENDLFLLFDLEGQLNENFRKMGGELGGSYDVRIRSDANGGGTQEFSIVYQSDGENDGMWAFMTEDGSKSIGVNDHGLELRISWSTLGNPQNLYEVTVTAQDCSMGQPCTVYDEGPCYGTP